MSYSDYLENKLQNHWLGGPDFTRPATVYLAASTTAPTDAGGNITEPVGGGYARVAITNNATNFPAAVNGVKTNGILISFPKATAAWGLITHCVLFDAPTGGNVLVPGELTVPKQIDQHDILEFEPESATFSLD